MNLSNLLIRTIDSAPKDGTKISTLAEGFFVREGVFWDGKCWTVDGCFGEYSPTHWVVEVENPESTIFYDSVLITEEEWEKICFEDE